MRRTLLVVILSLRVALGTTPEEKKRHLQLSRQFMEQTLKDYDPSSRPDPLDGSDHTSVIIHSNMYIARGHFNHHDLTLEVTYREEWEDERLKFSPFVDHISFPPSKPIWKPDTYFATAQEMKKSAEMQFVRVEPEGFVTTSQRYTLKLDCRPASSAYPIVDSISCLIRIGSWINFSDAYTTDDIVYFWRRFSPITYNRGEGSFQQYSLLEPVTGKCDANVSTGAYSCIEAQLTFQAGLRQPLLFFYLPGLLLILCSWLHFWVHGSWTVPRTLSALAPFVLFVSALLFLRRPATVGLSAWDAWLLYCSIQSFLSLLEYFVCICLGVRRTQPPPTASGEEGKPLLNQGEEGGKGARCSGRGGATSLDYFSRLAFPLAFAIFLALYLVLFLLL